MKIRPGTVIKVILICMLVLMVRYTVPLLANVKQIQTNTIEQNPSEGESIGKLDQGPIDGYSTTASTMTKSMLYESSPVYEATMQGEIPAMQGETHTTRGDILTRQMSLSTQGGGEPAMKEEIPTMQGDTPMIQEETSTTQGETPTTQGEPMSAEEETPTTQGERLTTQGESLKNLDILTRDCKCFQFDNAYKNPCWHETTGLLRCMPYFYIVGIRKAGTTHLWYYIVSHPDVLNPGIKENQLIGVKQSGEGRFISINAVWPGSSHTSHVFRESRVCRYLEENHHDLDKGVLLGDSGYPCRPFLLTPFHHPMNEREENYNAAHVRTRNIIERVFGIWKRKFHVLHSEVRMKPSKVSRVIVACAVLFNLSNMWNEPELQDVDDDEEQPQIDPFHGPQDGQGVRLYVTNNFFA